MRAGARVDYACPDLDGSDAAFRTLRAADFDANWRDLLAANPGGFVDFLAAALRLTGFFFDGFLPAAFFLLFFAELFFAAVFLLTAFFLRPLLAAFLADAFRDDAARLVLAFFLAVRFLPAERALFAVREAVSR